MTDLAKAARCAAAGIEAKGWVSEVPRLLHDLAALVDQSQAVAVSDAAVQAEVDRLHAQVARLKGAIKAAEASEWRDGGEPLSVLCLEAAGRVDDGEQVDGLSELLRAVSLRLEKAGA